MPKILRLNKKYKSDFNLFLFEINCFSIRVITVVKDRANMLSIFFQLPTFQQIPICYFNEFIFIRIDCLLFYLYLQRCILYCFHARGLIVHNFVIGCSIVGLLYDCAGAWGCIFGNLFCKKISSPFRFEISDRDPFPVWPPRPVKRIFRT